MTLPSENRIVMRSMLHKVANICRDMKCPQSFPYHVDTPRDPSNLIFQQDRFHLQYPLILMLPVNTIFSNFIFNIPKKAFCLLPTIEKQMKIASLKLNACSCVKCKHGNLVVSPVDYLR